MFNGLIQKWDLLEWKIALSGSISRAASTGTAPAVRIGAGLTSYYQTGLYDLSGTKEIGIDFGILAQEVYSGSTFEVFGSTGTYVTLDIPLLSISDVYTVSSSVEDADAELIFSDVALYFEVSGWTLKWSNLELKINGVTEHTYTTDVQEGGVIIPSGVPFFGVPPRIAASAAIDTPPDASEFEGACSWPGDGLIYDDSHLGGSPANDFPDYSKTASGSASASGGWRVYKNGEYHTFPVNVDFFPIPEGGCATGITAPSASSTYGGAATAAVYDEDSETTLDTAWVDPSAPITPATFQVQKKILHYSTHASGVTLLPDLTKGVVRMGDDYAALILAGALPEAKAASFISCCYQSKTTGCATPTDSSGDDSDEEVVFPETDLHLCRVADTAHSIEDVYAIPSYAPYSSAGQVRKIEYLKFRLHSILIAPDSPTLCYEEGTEYEVNTAGSSFPSEMTEPGNIFAYLRFPNDPQNVLPYLNFLVHPQASMVLFFPPDDDTDYWKVDGTKENFAYWGSLREQWFTYPGIDTGDDTERRNSIVADIHGGLPTEIVAAYILGSGVNSGWWGLRAFDADTTEPIASYTYDSDSASLWSATDATLTHGASITVNPSALTCVVELTLGSLTVEPFLYPHLCNAFTISWTGGTINSVSVELVTLEGDTIELATATGTHTRPVGAETKYGGDWEQDWGNSLVTDTGADLLPAGVSASISADAMRLVAYLLLNTRTAEKLRFTFTLSSHASDFTLSYPTLAVQAEDATLVQTASQICTILFPNGPGVRYGQWRTVDPVDFTPLGPDVREIGSPMTVPGFLVWKNLLLLALARDTDVTDQIEALYDSYEMLGATGDDVYYPAEGSLSFLLPGNKTGIGILVNPESQTYPLACWPDNAREADWTRNTAAWTQQSFSHCVEPRRYVSGGDAVNLFTADGLTQWTGASALTVAGWNIVEHNHAVDNNEAATFLLRGSDDVDIATVSPWHGYFLALFVEEAEPTTGFLIQACLHPAQIPVVAILPIEGGDLRAAVQRGVARAIADADGTLGWKVFPIEATVWRIVAEGATDFGLAMLPSAHTYLRYALGGEKQKTSPDLLTTLTTEADADPAISRHSQNGVALEQSHYFRATAGNSPDALWEGSGDVKFAQGRDGSGTLWTTEVTAVSGSAGRFCGGCWTGGQWGLLYRKEADGKAYWITTKDGTTWPGGSGTDVSADITWYPVGLVALPSGALIGLVWDAETSQEFKAVISRDQGATWTQSSTSIASLGALTAPPALLVLGGYALLFFVVADAPVMLASYDCGVTWVGV